MLPMRTQLQDQPHVNLMNELQTVVPVKPMLTNILYSEYL